MDRFAQMIARGGAAGRAGLRASTSPPTPERVGASIATGIGGLTSFQDCYDTLRDARPRPGQPVLDPVRSSRTWAPAGSRSSSARKGPLM